MTPHWRVSATRVLAVCAVLGSPRFADAQSPPAANPRPSPAADAEEANPFVGLELEPAQRAKILALTTGSRAAADAILARQRAGAPLSLEDRTALREIAERHNAAVDATLTPAQHASLIANVRRLNDRRPKRGEGGKQP